LAEAAGAFAQRRRALALPAGSGGAGFAAASEPLLLAEYERLAKLLPAEHAVLAKARRTIADAYRVNGKPDEGARWRAR